MYDARKTDQKSGGGLVFGLIVLAIMTALFAGILYLPSLTGPGKQELPGLSEQDGDLSLMQAFEDKATRDYVRKLEATFPSAAIDLEKEVRRARMRGADKVELGLIVLKAGGEDIAGSIDRLAKADVRHFNRLLDYSSDSLASLRASGAPYCMGSDLIEFGGLSDQELYRAVFDRVGHGAGLYEFGLELNGILLDAIRDARAAPVNYGRLSSADMQSLQRLGLSIATNPQIMLMLTTEGKSRREMDKVMASVDFCALGVNLIGQVKDLPDGTKGRLWGEFWGQVQRDGLERMFYRYAY